MIFYEYQTRKKTVVLHIIILVFIFSCMLDAILEKEEIGRTEYATAAEDTASKHVWIWKVSH